MKQTHNDIYEKFTQLGRDVKERLKKQGIAVPCKTEDGAVRVGHFKIKKNKTGFYNILDHGNEVIIDHINLPQSAALLANKLALGKWIDDSVLTSDRQYGHALFEEELHKVMADRSVEIKNYDRAEIMFTKLNIAKHKKEQHRKVIASGFDKLMRFR